jgi:hypothetical protein
MQSLLQKSILFVVFVLCYSAQQAQVLVKDSTALPKADAKLMKKEKALHFIAMGDWGRNGADHQLQVAKQMGITANEIGSMFTIATGDNFYPSGVISEFDPLWNYSFEAVYTDFRLQWDWYPVLGNHDYKSNPDAQVKYSTISRRWKMPARYYSKTFSINGDTTQQVLLVFIDTNPLISEFYKNAEYGTHVKGQDTAKQKRWMEKLLSNKSPNIKWKIVIGHHPMYSGGGRTEGYDTKAIRNSLKPMFDKYQVDVYLSGHEHSLQHMQSAGNMHHIISGAASEKTPARLIENSLMSASEYGFFVFSVTGNELLLQAVNDTGKIIYSYTIKK